MVGALGVCTVSASSHLCAASLLWSDHVADLTARSPHRQTTMAEQTQARYAFVTLLTSDSYLPGALTAVHSLLDVEGTRPDQPFDTVCLVTPATVGQDAIKALNKTFDHVVGVAEITTSNWANLDLLGESCLSPSENAESRPSTAS